jgi:hypothetical protein
MIWQMCRYGRSDRPAEMSQPASANGPICNTSVMAYDVATVVQFIFANRGISQVIPPYSMCPQSECVVRVNS